MLFWRFFFPCADQARPVPDRGSSQLTPSEISKHGRAALAQCKACDRQDTSARSPLLCQVSDSRHAFADFAM